MLDFLSQFLFPSGWEGHGHCFLWSPELLRMLVISNLLISLAYFSIPAALLVLIQKRRDLTHKPLFVLFALFIFGCGTTHLIKVWSIWQPVYWLQATADVITAGSSIGTALLLWPLLPQLVSIPSRSELEVINQALQAEIAERKRIEIELQKANAELERHVEERTHQATAAHREADRERRRIEAVLEALPVGVWIADEMGRIVQTNSAARRLWGGDAPLPTSTPGYHAYKGWHADSGEPLQADDWGLARAIQRGETSVGEIIDIERFDGTRGTIVNSAAPIRDADTDVLGAVAVSLDITAHQQAEEARQESEARLAGIIESAMDAIITVNEQQNIVVFNKAAENIFGVSRDEAIGQSLSRFIPQRFREAHRQHVRRFGETGVTARSMTSPGMLTALRANGEEFPIEATISHTTVGGEKLYSVILRDITQHKQAELERERMVAELEFERARLEAIVDQMPSGLAIAEAPSGRLVLQNRAGERILGHSMPALENINQNGQDGVLLHPDKRPYRAEEYPLARAVRHGDTINQEVMLYRRPDGEVIVLLVNAAPIRSSHGQIIAAVTTYEDITERKKAEETQALLASIVESSAESIVGKTLDGTIFSWNKGAERIYGYAAEEVVGNSISLIFPPERMDEEAAIMERIRQGESVTDFETVRKTADGRIIHVSLTVSPIRDVTGTVIGASAITRDITEQVMAEQHRRELLRLEQEARKSAEEANQLKDEFLAMISHELRTPLTSIMGFASTLLSEDVTWDTESQHQFIGIINDEAEKLKELVENLLDISRLQARTLRIHAEPHRLNEILKNARPQLEVLTNQHKLVYDIPDALPSVIADERRIAQVLTNLVHNAVKFSPSGTEIRISAESVENMVQVNVSDQGPGIPDEARSLVFEAFRQATTQTESGQGAGLGLAICKGLVEAHGGEIWLSDRDGPGTTVSFTLPAAPGHQ